MTYIWRVGRGKPLTKRGGRKKKNKNKKKTNPCIPGSVCIEEMPRHVQMTADARSFHQRSMHRPTADGPASVSIDKQDNFGKERRAGAPVAESACTTAHGPRRFYEESGLESICQKKKREGQNTIWICHSPLLLSIARLLYGEGRERECRLNTYLTLPYLNIGTLLTYSPFTTFFH
jgi:hypothetical protein